MKIFNKIRRYINTLKLTYRRYKLRNLNVVWNERGDGGYVLPEGGYYKDNLILSRHYDYNTSSTNWRSNRRKGEYTLEQIEKILETGQLTTVLYMTPDYRFGITGVDLKDVLLNTATFQPPVGSTYKGPYGMTNRREWTNREEFVKFITGRDVPVYETIDNFDSYINPFIKREREQAIIDLNKKYLNLNN